MARRALAPIAVLVGAFVLASLPLASRASVRAAEQTPELVWAPATLVISGRGWGHGIGLSQYGALGYA